MANGQRTQRGGVRSLLEASSASCIPSFGTSCLTARITSCDHPASKRNVFDGGFGRFILRLDHGGVRSRKATETYQSRIILT